MIKWMRTLCTISTVICMPWMVSGQTAAPARARAFATVSIADPRGIAVDDAGNIYVGDTAATVVYRLTPEGKNTVLKTPEIQHLLGVAVDRRGTVFISDDHNGKIYRVDATRAVTSIIKSADAVGLDDATTLVVDSKGNVFVGDNHHSVIRKITPAGLMSTFAGELNTKANHDGRGGEARFQSPRGLAIDRYDNLYVADEGNFNIRKIAPDGTVTTIAGVAGVTGSRDGAGTESQFGAPRGLAVDANGNVYVADTTNHAIRKITPAGVVSTLAGRTGEQGFTDGTGSAARFNQPRALAVDSAGNIYVADTGNHAVRMISLQGVVTTIAAAAKP